MPDNWQPQLQTYGLLLVLYIQPCMFLEATSWLRGGPVSIKLNAEALLARIAINQENFDTSALIFEIPCTMRRRGVETRFVMGGDTINQDKSLIANIAQAHQWLDRIKSGETLDQISESENTTRKRVQQTLNYAFLAPDIVRDILAGKQPIGLTSTWSATHDLPINWDDQRSLIAIL